MSITPPDPVGQMGLAKKKRKMKFFFFLQARLITLSFGYVTS